MRTVRNAPVGRQRRFCCRGCRNADTNNRLQNYQAQQQRGLDRKLMLVNESGGCCARCGYRDNLAALSWHHTDPVSKRFELDLRSLSNRSMGIIRDEVARCVLLCANCHAEEHVPHLSLDRIAV